MPADHAITDVLKKRLFFIAGTEKSGTTWLQQLIDAHPRAACRGEGQFFTSLVPEMTSAIQRYSTFVSGLNQKVFSETGGFPELTEASRLKIIRYAIGCLLSEYGAGREIDAVGEKTPGTTRALPLVEALFPQAKVIFILRDGRDIAISGWMHLQRQYGPEQARETLENYAIRIAICWWQDYMKALRFSVQHHGRMHIVRYEDLHESPRETLAGIFDFLDLASSDNILDDCLSQADFSRLSGGRSRGEENPASHFRKGIVGDWKNHFDSATIAAFESRAGDLLHHLGYGAATPVTSGALPTDPEAYVRSTTTLIQHGELDQAVRLCRQACLHHPISPKPYALLAECQRLRGRAGEALENSEIALELEPANASALMTTAWIRRDSKEYALALAALEELLTAHPGQAEALYLKGVTLQDSGKPEEALEAYAEAIERDPKHLQAMSMRAATLTSLGRDEDAVLAYRTALEHHPHDLACRNALVLSLARLGKYVEAVEEGTRTLALKDRVAMEKFDRSPLGKLRNDLTPPPFDASRPEKNIIAFSLWGNDPTYTQGAIANVRLAANIYYGWRCRFYCDSTVPTQVLKKLVEEGAEVRLVKEPRLQPLRALWRFFVSDDPAVERFLCRDTDSRLNVQEAVAVDAWLQSEKCFHVMRDHLFHVELILAGMWGGVAGILPRLSDIALSADRYDKTRWGDQDFLRNVVWPLIKNHALVHDSYFHFGEAINFPSFGRLPRPIHVGGAIKFQTNRQNQDP
jgi:tetratricopeptide (TPR) repeat protein